MHLRGRNECYEVEPNDGVSFVYSVWPFKIRISGFVRSVETNFLELYFLDRQLGFYNANRISNLANHGP